MFSALISTPPLNLKLTIKSLQMGIRSRGYKTFSMLNLAEHEILNAHRYKNIKKFSIFLDSAKPKILFFLLINVKMPTIVGILTFISWKNFMLS